jgi:hypothetical protein
LPNAWRRLDRPTEGNHPMMEALVWPQRRPYKKTTAISSESRKLCAQPGIIRRRRMANRPAADFAA